MKLSLAACFATPLLVATAASALTFGQIDTFEDGTTANWVVGVIGGVHPAPPQNVADGGPDGAGDNYLRLTSFGGNGPGSHLTVVNLTQWAGDYLGASINLITMHLINLGNTDLSIRLRFADPAGGPPNNVAITDSVQLPAGSGWQLVSFHVAPADLIALLGDTTLLLGATTELRIFHGEAPAFPGEPIAAQLGVDNILAFASEVPTAGASWSAVKALYR